VGVPVDVSSAATGTIVLPRYKICERDAHQRSHVTGLLGAFTTFSTWALESHRLGEDGQLRLGALNFLASLALGVAAVWLGRELGGVL
jgi:fluoride ion exporter CrcB/FEX